MHPLAVAESASSGGFGAYLAVFALVAIGWAGVPAVGGAVIAGAAVLASQGHLDIAAVLAAAALGAEAGGMVGYYVGLRWGRTVMNRPGPLLGQRQKALARGETLYAKWGRLAVFFTPCLISGIARMKFAQFVVWNFLAGAVYVLSVGPAAYGASQVASGQQDLGSVAALVAGGAVAAAAGVLAARYHGRRKARRFAAARRRRGADTPASAPADEDG